ncbi:MAG: hypothetical protein ACK5JT_14480 [Hyphomicrobiaceae bacterium]
MARPALARTGARMAAPLALMVAVMAFHNTPASALSCVGDLPATREISSLKARNIPLVAVEGRMTVATPYAPMRSPREAEANPSATYHTKAQIEGVDVASGKPFQATIDIRRECTGPWCGSIASTSWALVLVQGERGGQYIEVGPCGGSIYASYDRSAVARCVRTGKCD